jgi:hypothetical protein
MKKPTNVSCLPGLIAALAVSIALTVTADIARAKGSGGTHGISSLPAKHGLVHEDHNEVHHDAKDHERHNHEGKESSQRHCNTKCQGDKTAVVIPSGKTIFRISQPITRFSGKAVAGGIALHVNGRTFMVPGTSVTVKNEALSNFATANRGLTQTIVRNRDDTISDVLGVAPKPVLRGL